MYWKPLVVANRQRQEEGESVCALRGECVCVEGKIGREREKRGRHTEKRREKKQTENER